MNTTQARDIDRLDFAFEQLVDELIFPYHNLECCRTCAEDALTKIDDSRVRGWVYYDGPAAQEAADGGGLTLHFGGFPPCEENDRKIGEEICAALRAVGLTPRLAPELNVIEIAGFLATIDEIEEVSGYAIATECE